MDITEGIDDVAAQIITNRFGVPSRPRQQMLQAVWRDRPAVLGNRPAILAVQTRDHPSHQGASMLKRFEATKSRRDPIQHRRKLRLPPIRVYAMSRGGRGYFSCLHKHRTMPRSPP
jgi:hypothetical protein